MNRTKDAIAEAFTQLLDEKPISKITVKDIVDRCSVNRNTFYYHFQDIPALCEYIWQDKIDDLIRSHCHPDSLEEAASVAVNFFISHKTAVLHVYRSLSREVFLRYLNELAHYLVSEYIETISADIPLLASCRNLVIRYYKCTMVGLFLDWLDSDMNYDLLTMVLMFCDLRSESGQKMLEQLNKTVTSDFSPVPMK